MRPILYFKYRIRCLRVLIRGPFKTPVSHLDWGQSERTNVTKISWVYRVHVSVCVFAVYDPPDRHGTQQTLP